MANFGFLANDTFADKMDTQNLILAGILSAQGGSIKPTAWSEVQALVRAGLAGKVFNIGDQLTCAKGSTTLVWDIIGIDHDTPADGQFSHSLTLQLHDCLSSAMQHDAREAFYYAEEGLSAGTYYFTLASDYGSYWKSGDYRFTLTEDVPVGGQLCFSGYANTTALTGLNVEVYENGAAASASESVAITSGGDGTFLGTIENETVQDSINSAQRSSYGSNNWVESAMRQFLNSDGAAGAVWSAQTKFDRCPSWASTTAGFMNGIDEDFLAVIGKPTKITARNTVCDGGGSDTTEDLFWLLSRREVYAGNEVSTVTEGEPYPYYSDYSDLTAAGTTADTNRIKYRNGSAQHWRLRTPNAGGGCYVRLINTTGALTNYNDADSTSGVAPACCII